MSTSPSLKQYYVYWIQSDNRAYIGATVDPTRRLRQHNSVIKGGSRRTHGRGPWKFMCVVRGFRTWHEALCFEWRLQYDSKRCRSIASRRCALDALMAKDRWTINSPLAKDVPLVVEHEPTHYGLPPENYDQIKSACSHQWNGRDFLARKKKYKRLWGTY